MPFFRVELERLVSRRVELRQNTEVIVEAPDMMAANNAVLNISGDENQLCKYMVEWSDIDSSRIAHDDEQERRPTILLSSPTRMILGGPILNAMPSE